MYRDMRRKDRQLSEQAAREILGRGLYGVLSTVGMDGMPYGIPISYAVEGDTIYFHCAKSGHKTQNLAHEPRASFCVVGGCVQPVFENDSFTCNYESAVVCGTVRLVEEPEEKRRALLLLSERYFPACMDKAGDIVEQGLPHVTVYALTMERVSGKARQGANNG